MNSTRIQFELDGAAVEFLDSLREQAAIRTRTEALRHAIALLAWAIDKSKQDYKIVAVKEGSDVAKELSMPILEEAALRGRKHRKTAANA